MSPTKSQHNTSLGSQIVDSLIKQLEKGEVTFVTTPTLFITKDEIEEGAAKIHADGRAGLRARRRFNLTDL